MKKKEKSLLERIKIDFNKIIVGNIILNILFMIFGIIVYMNPTITARVIGIIIGIYFMIFGLMAIYEFLMRKDNPIFSHKIFLAVLLIILGLFIMINPFKIVKFLTFGLGIYLIIMALFKTIEALSLKKYKYDGWVIMIVISLLLLVFGIFITINPMASISFIEATGIFIILACILEISNLLMLYKKAKDIAKLFKKTK